MLETSIESLTNEELENIEYNLVLSAIKKRYGHDFGDYAQKSLKRRLEHHVKKLGLNKLTDLITPIIYNDTFFGDLLNTISVPVTEMYRDPSFFYMLREKVLPLLQTYPNINIWHAGCSTGEEVYSMAIMLEEEGLYDNCHIFATDFNAQYLKQAQEGIYNYKKIEQYSDNYYASGGKKSFTDYYHDTGDGIKINKKLTRNITFAKHNLASDSAFGQFNLILCRNVLIYFEKQLQNKVFDLFYDSTLPLGYLCLGSHESLSKRTALEYDTISNKHKIYRKKK